MLSPQYSYLWAETDLVPWIHRNVHRPVFLLALFPALDYGHGKSPAGSDSTEDK